jgi:predicted RNase H-like HicB family nuclease
VQVKKEGKWYVATDLVTHVADQGKTRQEALQNLSKGLREHYELLLQQVPRKRGTTVLDIEV